MIENKTKATFPKSSDASVTRVCSLNSSLMRHLWSIVEETQTNILLGFSDTELVHQLLRQLEFRGLLDTEESNIVSAYLYSRLLLIRDLAKARLA
ncbi:hypothetical protein [Brunnivagina elsteri]